ncbi:MAG: hypothetical protein ABFD16_30155 [Thermoguttaceae bacterium]
MNARLASPLLLCALFLAGCGTGGPTAPPPSDTEIGQMAKTRVAEFVQKTKTQPKAAASNLALLLESLDAFAAQYGGPYVELRDTAKQLQGMYQRKASKQEIEGQLGKLTQQADALPSK